NAKIGPANGPFRPHHAEYFDRARVFAPCANPGCVDQEKFVAGALVADVDSVARRSRQLAHDGAGIAQDGIDERRFPGVRLSDDGEGEGRSYYGFRISDFGLGKKGIDSFEKTGNAAAVRGADGN